MKKRYIIFEIESGGNYCLCRTTWEYEDEKDAEETVEYLIEHNNKKEYAIISIYSA